MRRLNTAGPAQAATGGMRFQQRLAVGSSLIATAVGVVASLYSVEIRGALEASWRGLWSLLPVIVTAFVASWSALFVYHYLFRRGSTEAVVTRGAIEIDSSALRAEISDEDAIVGRSLHYLEVKRNSTDLVVFLHGLGLDASDFRPYLTESKFHCIALTLYGFNSEERDDSYYRPISLEAHLQLVAYALERIKVRYPRKRMTLVGFSFGADICVFLGQSALERIGQLRLRKVVLLDPNVNSTTTTISSRIARIESASPVGELIEVLGSARNNPEFRYLCEYLSKITSKNFAQIRRHAKDVVGRWSDDDSYELFLDSVGQLNTCTEGVYVVLSFNHEEVFNTVALAGANRGLDINSMQCTRSSHFELIGPGFLKERLEGIL